MPKATDVDSRTFDAVKDPLDLRDLYYESGLDELPFEVDNRGRVPAILNQGQEGACTGFGLAAVVNYLLHNRKNSPQPKNKPLTKRENGASPRMLYEMAKRYDEWEGENYNGSSIRGAMKGWSRHGVCTWADWPYEPNEPGRLTPARQRAAVARPMGAYYRVRHLHLNQMQSALHEAGVLYGSAQVHEGWQQVGRDGIVPYTKNPIGGHAFAIVGYDDGGLWVQNSWGAQWGAKGFCYLSYEDWLENAFDCWVARLGVPMRNPAMDQVLVPGRGAEFGFVPDESIILEKIRPHFVDLGNDGRFSHSGRYASHAEDVEGVVLSGFKTRSATWEGPKRLMIYCHGGLNDERASASRIASMLPYFMANEIYPLHFMWETGVVESVTGIVQDAFRRGRFRGWAEHMEERFFDLLDQGIEIAAKPLGRPLWRQMKDNAERASDRSGGARFTGMAVADCLKEVKGPTELHLVGHSAGSIFIAHLLDVFQGTGTPVKSLVLYAPACTLALFDSKIRPRLGGVIERFASFHLTDRTERDDTVGGAYRKSLLYLVSESFEERPHTPLLGMERFLDASGKELDAFKGDRELVARAKRAIGAPVKDNGKTAIRAQNVPKALNLDSQSTSHGGFDNDEATLNSTLQIITGRRKLVREF